MFCQSVVLLLFVVWLCAVPVCAQPPDTAAGSASVVLRPDCDLRLEELAAEATVWC